MILEVMKIKPVTECDDIDELNYNVKMHREMVGQLMKIIGDYINYYGLKHDWTKTEHLQLFWEDVLARKNNSNISFTDREWGRLHIDNEHHHLNIKVEDNITLIDILEFLCDCIITAKSTGQDIDSSLINLDSETLILAYDNTAKWLDNITEVVK